MKRLKTKQLFIILVLGITVLSFGTAIAQKAKLANPKAVANESIVRQNTGAIVEMRFKTDLEVRHISASQCFCNDSLSNVGAMLYKDLWVTVVNSTCSDGKGADNVKAFLDVQYFDVMADRMVALTLPVTLDKNGSKQVKVRSGFVLVKQTPGIKATIRMGSNNPSVVDCNSSNNRKITKRCQLPLVY
jgi:hypothetical protein